jgi:CubicO group peptidase (beta-lactamase class C family)
MNVRSCRLLPIASMVLIYAALMGPVPGVKTVAAQSQIDFSQLRAVAEAELKEINAPGAAIAVVKGDRIVYQDGFGVANVETREAVKADMLFRVGSVTKMFTTAALVSLAEEGRLKLGDPINKYANGLSAKLGQVTTHQLMSHTAGMRDEAPAYGLHDESALATTVRGWGDEYVFIEPGRVMSYSNPGLTLAGFVLEQAAGKPYADVLDERLFKPLGMARTTFKPTVAMTWPLSQGHTARGQEPPAVVRPFADNSGYWPAGFIFSSATDLARFTIAFMNAGVIDGHAVLKPSAIQTMSTGYVDVPSSAENARYCYGLTTVVHRGVRLVEHGGAIDGFGASVRMLPDHRAAVVVLVNRSGAQLQKTSERALELLAVLQPATPPSTTPIAMSAAELAKLAGVYVNPPVRVELAARGGKLYFRRGAQETEVVKVGDLRFSMTPTPGGPAQTFALVPGADGTIAFLHIGSRAFRRASQGS